MLDGIERTDLGKLIEYLGCLRIGLISVSFASIFTSAIRQKSRNGERITFVVTLPLTSPRRSRSDGTMTRGGRKSGNKKMHEPNAASTEAQTKRRSNLLEIGVRSGGVWKVGVTGTLKLSGRWN